MGAYLYHINSSKKDWVAIENVPLFYIEKKKIKILFTRYVLSNSVCWKRDNDNNDFIENASFMDSLP